MDLKMKEEKIELEKGKEYYCWFSGRILQFVDWFKEDETPYVRDNYDPSFSGKKGKRTWSWKYLREATNSEIIKYKNDLLNKHRFKEFTLVIDEDDSSYLWSHDEGGIINFKLDEIERVQEIVKKGYVKKY